MTDDDLYYEAAWLARNDRYREALDLLRASKNINKARVLNYIGYSTRKLGNVDEGIKYYKKALAIDPDYIRAREYLGEGYLQKGDVKNAKVQLEKIEKVCGNKVCEEYLELADEIGKFEARKKTSG